MRVLIINEVCGTGSHGKICMAIAEKYESQGAEVKIAYGRTGAVPGKYKKYAVRIGNRADVYKHAVYTRITDKHGFASRKATKKFLELAERFKPDLLWLHNLHGYYLNIELLFNWIKRQQELEVRWTLHDCWAFTGHCAHFTEAGCSRWKSQCHHCPQKKEYPAAWLRDNSRWNYVQKKKLFTGVKNMTLITPSQWLAGLVKESFLKDYPVRVRYNTVDTSVFRPVKSDFRKKYGLEHKKIVLGVSAVWNRKKGLDDLLELASMLDETYAVVLVGLTGRQIRNLPKKVRGLKKTDSPGELASVYAAADIFVNPSREESYGMTTAEAASCGTFPVVYQGTAGEEAVARCGGIAVPAGAENLYEAVTGRKFVKGGGGQS